MPLNRRRVDQVVCVRSHTFALPCFPAPLPHAAQLLEAQIFAPRSAPAEGPSAAHASSSRQPGMIRTCKVRTVKRCEPNHRVRSSRLCDSPQRYPNKSYRHVRQSLPSVPMMTSLR